MRGNSSVIQVLDVGRKVFNYTILVLLFTSSISAHAQISCDELTQRVKSEDYGSTYYSSGSESIAQVSFHTTTDASYNSYYFAIVRFKNSYQDYIYQVSDNTESSYVSHYQTSAGKAFWKYIQPYNDVLGCAR